MQYQENLMMQPWENGKNPNFGPNLGTAKFFSWVSPLLVVRQCSKLSCYAISRKTNEPNFRKLKIDHCHWMMMGCHRSQGTLSENTGHFPSTVFL